MLHTYDLHRWREFLAVGGVGSGCSACSLALESVICAACTSASELTFCTSPGHFGSLAFFTFSQENHRFIDGTVTINHNIMGLKR